MFFARVLSCRISIIAFITIPMQVVRIAFICAGLSCGHLWDSFPKQRAPEDFLPSRLLLWFLLVSSNGNSIGGKSFGFAYRSDIIVPLFDQWAACQPGVSLLNGRCVY